LTKILIVTYGGGHARMLKPVILELLKYGNCDLQVLALNTAETELAGLDVELLGYRDFFSESDEIAKYGKELASTLDKIINYDETISYLGANFLELQETYGLKVARKMYSQGGRYIFQPKRIMEHILKAVRPNILVTTNSPRSERYAVVAARKLGIKSIAFVDMFGIRSAEWLKDNEFADKILVLSESVKGYLISLGRNADSIVVTGNPSFDILSSSYREKENLILENRRQLPFTVLWASQPEPSFLPETGAIGDEDLPVKTEEVLIDIFEKNKS